MFKRVRASRVVVVAPLMLAGALILGACDDDGGETTTTATTTATAAATTSTETATATTEATETPATAATEEAETVEVTAVDYEFQNLPETVEVGTTLTLVNESEGEVHELVAIKLPEGEDRPVDELIALPEEEIGALMGDAMPSMVLVAMPGEAGEAVVGTGELTEAGRYIVLCAVPIGADPEAFAAAAQNATQAPEVEGGPPHFTAGMYGEITVE